MGGLFSKPKVPQVKVQAPSVENPVPEPAEPELGAQETAEENARKGKKGLKIKLNNNGLQKGAVGTNIT